MTDDQFRTLRAELAAMRAEISGILDRLAAVEHEQRKAQP
jgi:hypothetical protein